MTKYLTIILLLLSVFDLRAQKLQSDQKKQWSLNECIGYAVENSPRVNKQVAQNTIHHQEYRNAIGKLLPSLSAGTNSYFNFGRGVDSETNLYTNINSFSNAYSIYSNLTIFDGLSNIYKIKMEKANKFMGKKMLEQEREMVAYDTMEAFINVLYYKRIVQLAEEQVYESANNLRQTKRMEELGIKAKPDVAEMEAKHAADNYNLTKQKNLKTIGIIILKERMSFPIDEELEFIDAYDDMLIAKPEAAAQEIYESAKIFNPKTLSAAYALKVQEMSMKTAGAGFSPVISIDAGFSTGFVRYLDGSDYDSFEEQLKNKRGSYIGFTLSVPIFNGFSKLTNYRKKKAMVDIAKNEYDETLRAIYSEIEQAIADVKGQADAHKQALLQRKAMEVAHEANQRKYEEGLISPLELHTSANRVVGAKAEEVNAELQYRLKARLLNYYRGESFIQ